MFPSVESVANRGNISGLPLMESVQKRAGYVADAHSGMRQEKTWLCSNYTDEKSV